MPCSPYREAVSARLDGEPLGMLSRELDEHLADCPGCASWASDAAVVTRRARLAAAPAVPDLTAAVLTALPRELPGAAAAARARLADSALRLALVAVGVAQAVMAWPVLISGTGAMSAPTHMNHETGAWNLAVAAAFLAVAAAPSRCAASGWSPPTPPRPPAWSRPSRATGWPPSAPVRRHSSSSGAWVRSRSRWAPAA